MVPSQKGDCQTHRKPHPSMLIDITKVAINHHALGTQVLRPGTHQPAPARRVHAFGLRDEDNAILLDPVGEVLGCFGSCGVAGLNHLDGVSRPEDFRFTGLLGRREHFDAMQVTAVRDF